MQSRCKHTPFLTLLASTYCGSGMISQLAETALTMSNRIEYKSLDWKVLQ